jgi:hypothetical protein
MLTCVGMVSELGRLCMNLMGYILKGFGTFKILSI